MASGAGPGWSVGRLSAGREGLARGVTGCLGWSVWVGWFVCFPPQLYFVDFYFFFFPFSPKGTHVWAMRRTGEKSRAGRREPCPAAPRSCGRAVLGVLAENGQRRPGSQVSPRAGQGKAGQGRGGRPVGSPLLSPPRGAAATPAGLPEGAPGRRAGPGAGSPPAAAGGGRGGRPGVGGGSGWVGLRLMSVSLLRNPASGRSALLSSFALPRGNAVDK